MTMKKTNLKEFIRDNRNRIFQKWKTELEKTHILLAPATKNSDDKIESQEYIHESHLQHILDFIVDGKSKVFQLPTESGNNKITSTTFGYVNFILQNCIERKLRNSGVDEKEIINELHGVLENLTLDYYMNFPGSSHNSSITYSSEKSIVQEDAAQAERLAVIGQLAAGVAHEIGNPLTSISSIVQILRRKTNDQFTLEQLNNIKHSIDRIANIVHELVDFARPAPFDPVPGQLNNVIQTAVEMMKYDRRVKNISIETSYSDGVPQVLLVHDQMLQVFINLLINAVDAMKGVGKISIKTWCDDHYINASITDTGCGISKIILPRIFDPFFTTKKVGEGTGLGLTVSYGIINKHYGKIDVQSTVNGGSTFTVKLPLQHSK